MAAGQGFKTFTTGEVLTASDVNGYLMQGVLVFASAAARDAAITSPQEGQYAYLKDTNVTYYYDGSTWVVSGATGDITSVTAGTGISGGGASGDVTITNSMATAIDAKGDLVAGTGADAFSRLAVGANDTVLTADSSTATGLKWAAASAGGMTLLSTTTLSGSSTTISGISGSYTDLKILFYGVSLSGNANIRIAPNNDATISWFNGMVGGNTVESNAGYWTVGAGVIDVKASTTTNAWSLTIYDYANTSTMKSAIMSGTFPNAANTQFVATGTQGGIRTTSAISSLVFSLSSQTFGAGTVLIYGVK